MKKQTIIGLVISGITVIASTATAVVINRMNKKQLDKVEIKVEVKEEMKEDIYNDKTEKETENQNDEDLNIDDTDIEV